MWNQLRVLRVRRLLHIFVAIDANYYSAEGLRDSAPSSRAPLPGLVLTSVIAEPVPPVPPAAGPSAAAPPRSSTLSARQASFGAPSPSPVSPAAVSSGARLADLERQVGVRSRDRVPRDNSRAVSLDRSPSPLSSGEVAHRHGDRGRSPVDQVVRRRRLSSGSVEVTGEVSHDRNGSSPAPFAVAKEEDNEGGVDNGGSNINNNNNNVEVRPRSSRAQGRQSQGSGPVVIDVDDEDDPVPTAGPNHAARCASGPVLEDDDESRSRSRRNPGPGSAAPATSVEGARSRVRFPVRSTRRPTVLERPESEFIGEQFLLPARQPLSGGRRAAAAPPKRPSRPAALSPAAARPSAVLRSAARPGAAAPPAPGAGSGASARSPASGGPGAATAADARQDAIIRQARMCAIDLINSLSACVERLRRDVLEPQFAVAPHAGVADSQTGSIPATEQQAAAAEEEDAQAHPPPPYTEE